MYYPRMIQPCLIESLQFFPVVLLTGARQVGKSTIALELMDNYVTLDDINIYSSLRTDPQGFIKSLKKPTAIDEVQKEPTVLGAIKLDVDAGRINGQYLLTGSANVMGQQEVTDTLAGRIALLELLPLSCKEIASKNEHILDLFFGDVENYSFDPVQEEQVVSQVVKGGYPEIQKIASVRGRYQWFSSYIRTYIERDVRDLGELKNLDKFIRMYGMLASRSGNLLNKLDIARDAGINVKTLENYLELLKLVYQLVILQPYSINIDRRLTKAGKLFFTDSGVLSHLLGVAAAEDFLASPYRGSIFETFIFAELFKAARYSETPTGLFFFQTAGKREIDFIIERGGRIAAVEVKYSRTVQKNDFNAIMFLQSRLKSFQAGYVLYMGDRILPFGKGLYALPVSVLF